MEGGGRNRRANKVHPSPQKPSPGKDKKNENVPPLDDERLNAAAEHLAETSIRQALKKLSAESQPGRAPAVQNEPPAARQMQQERDVSISVGSKCPRWCPRKCPGRRGEWICDVREL